MQRRKMNLDKRGLHDGVGIWGNRVEGAVPFLRRGAARRVLACRSRLPRRLNRIALPRGARQSCGMTFLCAFFLRISAFLAMVIHAHAGEGLRLPVTLFADDEAPLAAALTEATRGEATLS